MRGIGLQGNFQLRLAVPTWRLWAFARVCRVQRDRTTYCCTDNALFRGKLASGWPINRRDNPDTARIILPGRMESMAVPRQPDH